MPNRGDPERRQIVGGQAWEHLFIDVVATEGVGIRAEAEAHQPCPNIHVPTSQAVEALPDHYIANTKPGRVSRDEQCPFGRALSYQ